MSGREELAEYSKSSKLDQELSRVDKRDRILEKDKADELAVLEEVFDTSTLTVLYQLLRRGVLDQIFGVVNSGKESRIYHGLNPKGEGVAIKIFLTSSKEFRRGMLKYIEGDPRFRLVRRDTRSLIYTWARKEFKNLQRAHRAGIRVPKPIHVEKNVLVMEFIGEDGVPAPTVRERPPEKPSEVYELLLNQVKTLYKKAGLVHGDLSEYNVMNVEEKPVIFDLSQAVALEHPRAMELLHRDLRNLNRFFGGLGARVMGLEKAFKWIVEDE